MSEHRTLAAAYYLGQDSARAYRARTGRPQPLRRPSDIGEWLLTDLEQFAGCSIGLLDLHTLAKSFLAGVASDLTPGATA